MKEKFLVSFCFKASTNTFPQQKSVKNHKTVCFLQNNIFIDQCLWKCFESNKNKNPLALKLTSTFISSHKKNYCCYFTNIFSSPKIFLLLHLYIFPFCCVQGVGQPSHSKIGLIWVTFVTFWKLYLCCNLFVDRCSTSEKVLSTQQTLVRARPTQKCPKQTVCRSFSTVDIYCNPDHARNVTNNINWITWVMDNCCLLFSSEFTKEQKESLSRCRIFLWKKKIFLSKRSHSDLILKLSQL